MELSLSNITRETLFPGLDEAARAVKAERAISGNFKMRNEYSQINSRYKDAHSFFDLDRPELPPRKWAFS